MVTTNAPSKKRVAKKAGLPSRPVSRTPVEHSDAIPIVDIPDDAQAPHDVASRKLVRDSFTIPEAEYKLFALLKARLLGLARPTKKSELMRAGIAALASMPDPQLLEAVARVPSLKTGRPSKPKASKKKN